MRITAYADRLLADLDQLDWSESIKLMQRNWIGRSTGALGALRGRGPRATSTIEVFTTRPDTLFGATYMVLAPEHPLVDVITANEWPGDDVASDWSSAALDAWKGIVRRDGHAGRRGRALPRVRGDEVGARAPGRRPREDRRVHRRVRDQPHQLERASRSSSPTTC